MAAIEADLQPIAFPKLSDDQIATVARVARCRTYENGQTLFEVGDTRVGFFVVKSGEVEIVDRSGDAPRTVTVHHPGEFTGDVSHVTGNPAVVSAVARGRVDVYEVTADDFRALLGRSTDLSDLLLRAFIARREILEQGGWFTGLRVIGSRFSRDTFRVRDFLSRNRVVHTFIDLEDDPQVDRLLRQFNVTEAETPVVSCGGGDGIVQGDGRRLALLLRNPTNRELADEIGIRRPIEQKVYDLAVAGAGPAGLAAAV